LTTNDFSFGLPGCEISFYPIFIAGYHGRYKMTNENLNTVFPRGLQIYALNEESVTVKFGEEINGSLAMQISIFNHSLRQQPFPGFLTTVPAYTTIRIVYNPLVVIHSLLPGNNCYEKVSNYLQSLVVLPDERLLKTETITIPVCYEAAYSADLNEVAKHTGLSPEEIIALHSAQVYKVHMIGFIPGFAYLGGMNRQLFCPRKAQPRRAVPAGAVGIAGHQTGVYPLNVPGGWQIIGQTPYRLFDIGRQQPSLLKAGDEVIFKAIGRDEFSYLQGI
jgi:inhibitor of KinA